MRRLLLLLLLPLACAQAAPPAFTEHAVTQSVAGGILYGTELVPEGQGKVPVVLLHAGSGPTDRDGNSRVLPGPNNSLRQLAEALARKGIASLRYDKRLIGASTAPAWKEDDIRFDDYISDVQAWSRQLRADSRFSRLVLAGHSEGALIVTVACNPSGADACISMAGMGRNFADVLDGQLQASLPPELQAQSADILARLRKGETASYVPQPLLALYRPSVQPYLISLMKYDPAAIAAAIQAPLLIAQGTSDIQVSVKDAEALAAAAPRAKLVIVDGMNHVLKMVGTDPLLQQKSYISSDLPVSPQLVDELVTFILAPQGK